MNGSPPKRIDAVVYITDDKDPANPAEIEAMAKAVRLASSSVFKALSSPVEPSVEATKKIKPN